MIKSILSFVFLLFLSGIAIAQVSVNGHYRKNGTYVEPHYRSSPNQTKDDNYSTKGNINPYTGKEGTKNGDGYYYGNNYYTRPIYLPITKVFYYVDRWFEATKIKIFGQKKGVY